MQTYHQARVGAADIDDLGHMNVRVYARHAAAGVHGLLAALEFAEPAQHALGARIEQPDCHTLFRREQLEGAPIAVRGGVIGAGPAELQLYLELFNVERDELSATVHKVVRLVDRQNRKPLEFPPAVLAGAEQLQIAWPDHGKPRSLPARHVRRDLTPGDMQAKGIPVRFDGYEVTPAMATPEGYMDLAGAPWLAFADGPIKREEREAVEGAEEQSWFGDGSISVATLEARHTLVDVPRVGEKVVSYTGITDIGRKIMRFCHWSFAKDSGRLLAVLDEVGIGLNLQTRRSCEFPPAMREELQAQSHPELF